MPELATGEFEEFVSQALQFAHTEVLKLCDGLPAEEKIFVIEEFEDGRGSLVFTIRLKITSTYSRIPNSLGCLGHKDESKARHFLILSRQQFDELTPVMKSKAHFLTLLVFSTDNIIGREAEEFMRGKPRNDCSHLLILAVLFLMMSTAERAGERPHALVARALKNLPNAGMAVLSGSLGRNQEIQRFLDHNPKNLLKFEEQMYKVYHPAMAAKELGIANHRDLEKLQRDQVVCSEAGLCKALTSNWGYAKHLKRVIYHTDRESRFQIVGSKTSKKYESVALSDLDSILDKYALELLRSRVTQGDFLVVPKDKTTMAPLVDAVHTRNLLAIGPPDIVLPIEDERFADFDPSDAVDDDVELDTEPPETTFDFEDDGVAVNDAGMVDGIEDVNRVEAASPALFFKIVNKRPSNVQILRSDADSCLSPSDLVVTRHSLVRLDKPGKHAWVSMAPCRENSALGVGGGEATMVLEKADFRRTRIWTRVEGKYSVTVTEALLPRLIEKETCYEILTAMVKAEAWPHTGSFFMCPSPEWGSALENLRLCGLVCHFTTQSPQPWKLTELAAKHVVVAVQLGNYRRLLLPASKEKSSWSHYELLECLLADGWKHAVWIPPQDDRGNSLRGARPAPFELRDAEAERVFYTRATDSTSATL